MTQLTKREPRPGTVLDAIGDAFGAVQEALDSLSHQVLIVADGPFYVAVRRGSRIKIISGELATWEEAAKAMREAMDMTEAKDLGDLIVIPATLRHVRAGDLPTLPM